MDSHLPRYNGHKRKKK